MKALLILCVASLGGAIATYAYDEEASLEERLSAGVCVGMAVLGLLGLVLGLVLGLRPLTVVLAALGTAAPLGLLWRAPVRSLLHKDLTGLMPGSGRGAGAWRRFVPGIALVLVFFTLFATFRRAMLVGPDGIGTGVDHNLGDLPFHLAVISAFAWGENIPPEHPELSGARLTYPFLIDFVAAMLVRTGSSLHGSLLLQNLFLVTALVGLLYRWARRLTGDPLAALTVLALVFFNGGLGFLLLFGDVQPREGLFALLPHLTHDYTILPHDATFLGHLRWGNTLTTLLVPQRSLLLGLPLFLHVSTLWWKALAEGAQPGAQRRAMTAAGVVAGLLPLCHVHTLIVVLGAGAGLALLHRGRLFWVFFAAALAVGLPQGLWVLRGSSVEAARFLAWHVGWDRGGESVVGFWLRNSGAFIPLLLVAILRTGPRRVVPTGLLRFAAPFALFFVVPNCLQLSPWIWDNIKLLVYWHIASTPLVALLLARLWRGRGAWRLLSVALLSSLTASGGLDVWRVASGSISRHIFSPEAIACAEEIRQTTPPRAVIVSRPSYDSPVFLTGRKSLLGYPGHIWSQGLDDGGREAAIQRIYAGEADASALLATYGVDFILVGPQQRPGGESLLAGRTPVTGAGGYRLYRVEP